MAGAKGDDRVIAAVHVSRPRRLLGLAVLGGLAALLFGLALFEQDLRLGTRLGMGLPAAAALWVGLRLGRATQYGVELTEAGILRSTDGREIARMPEIEMCDRGFMAFKPSNGFVLRLKDKAGAVWEPGLWWRLGRRVGVGGVTSAVETRTMADLIRVQIEERSKGAP